MRKGPPRPARAPAGSGRAGREGLRAAQRGQPRVPLPAGNLPPSGTRKTRRAAGRASPGATGRGCRAAARAPGASARAGGARSHRPTENRGRPGIPLRSLGLPDGSDETLVGPRWRGICPPAGAGGLQPLTPEPSLCGPGAPPAPRGQADVLPSRPARKPRGRPSPESEATRHDPAAHGRVPSPASAGEMRAENARCPQSRDRTRRSGV